MKFSDRTVLLLTATRKAFLLGVVFWLVLLGYNTGKILLFANYGIKTKATVIAKFEEATLFSILYPELRKENLVVTYNTEDGKTLTSVYRVYFSDSQSVPLNATTNIFYLKNYPTFITGEGEAHNFDALMPWFIILWLVMELRKKRTVR